MIMIRPHRYNLNKKIIAFNFQNDNTRRLLLLTPSRIHFSTSEKPTKNEQQQQQEEEQQTEKKKNTSILDRIKELNVHTRLGEILNTTKERLFAKDETSWKDAFRAVFGLKSEDKKGEEFVEQSPSATTQEQPNTTIKEEEKLTPEQEAKEFMQAQQAAQSGPSPYELKIIELGKQIQSLENEREEAQNASEMNKFKELNKQIREKRREIEQIQAKMNTTSVVKVEERKGAWESFSETLRDTPLLRGIFGFGETKAGQTISNAAEDAREAWETSQHPLVYRVQSAYDSMFGETEMGEAIREFRKIDPAFSMEGFLKEMEEETIPVVLGAFLRGDSSLLNKYLGEGAFAAVRAAIDERKNAGRRMDPNILNIQHTQVVAAKVVEKVGPICVIQFMAQQIDALYDNAGNVVEGKDDAVAAVFYAFAMTRERSETTGQLKWVIKEFAIVGTVPWI